MRMMIQVGWLLCGLLLMSVTSANGLVGPSYFKLRSGTLVAGEVDDLLKGGHELTLVPKACHAGFSVLELGAGFVIEEEFDTLDVAGSIQASSSCTAMIVFKNFATGKWEPFAQFILTDSPFVSREIPVHSAAYRETSTSEVELWIVISCICLSSTTGKDAVSVQELTIGPTPN